MGRSGDVRLRGRRPGQGAPDPRTEGLTDRPADPARPAPPGRPSRVPALARSLRYRPFALVFAGQTVSRVGDAIHTIALAWLVLELTGSAAAMGAVLIAQLVPWLVLLLIGGVVVDRVSRLRLMVASDVLRGLSVLAIALLAAADALQLWHLLAFGVAFGSVSAFFDPAYRAVVPDLVPVADRPSANSLQSLSRQLAAIVGPGLGAILVAAGGTAIAFALDAASYGVAAVFVLAAAGWRRAPVASGASSMATGAPRQRADTTPEPADAPIVAGPTAAGPVDGRRTVLADLREGLATVVASPWIWISIAVAGISNITLAGPLEAVLPLLVEEHLGAGVGTLGLLASLGAIGAAASAVALGRLRRIRHRGLLVYGAWLVLCAATVLYGLPVGLAGASLAALVVGAANTTLNLSWASSLQDLVPADRLGRVMSIDSVGSAALIPIGYAVAGIAADAWGPATVFVAGGLVSAVVIVAGMLHPSVRGLD